MKGGGFFLVRGGGRLEVDGYLRARDGVFGHSVHGAVSGQGDNEIENEYESRIR